ncbi:hypothetical protein [Hymenobacter sp. BT559]|uniref:hypothetical protein n=1 Tax=Hymenobacter sp. BT559 TaxID=2795729 RepID=UPI0018EE2632|nr:hypothetical protein [Hymenobacter sp. BT559]MBJ6141786.1 hypothetical protein [Hymenobacter sp. BT559]
MATISCVAPEEHAAALQRIDRLEKLLEAYVTSNPEWLTTAQALVAAGIRSRETLVKYYRASGPNKQEVGRITYCKEGRRCFYLRSSCIDYRLRKLGQPALRR